MRKTLIAMLGLVAIGLWALPAVAGVSVDPPKAKEYQPLDGRPGAIGALAKSGNYQATLSGTVVQSASATTTWFLYPGACNERALSTWAAKTTPHADSLDTYSVGGLGGYTRLDLSSVESIWGVVSAATSAAERPAILNGSFSLWCGKYDPNWVVQVGYPNLTFQIMYIDTGAHGANYDLTLLMNLATEQNYDYVHLVGGGVGATDPIGNSRLAIDEAIATGHTGDSDLLVTWTGSIRNSTPGANAINTLGGHVQVLGAGSGPPDAIVPVTITLGSGHRALYFVFTADCLFSHEDGLFPDGQGVIFDDLASSDNGGIYSEGAAAGGSDPTGGNVIVGTFGTAPYVATRVAPGVGELWQIVDGGFAATSDNCQLQKNDTADHMFFGVDTASKNTIPGQFNSVVSCTFPVPAGTASLIALWGEYLDLPRGAGYVQYSEYRHLKAGSWSNWENTSAAGGVITSTIKTWLVDGDELAAATQSDEVQVRYNIQCIAAFATDRTNCGTTTYGILYDDLSLHAVTGVPAPLMGIFPSQTPHTTFVDGTMTGLNCSSVPCWPGVRGSDLGTPGDRNIAVHDNVNSSLGDSTTVGLATGLRKNGMGINWKNAFSKAVDAGETIVYTNGAFVPAFDTPRAIYRLFDPATLTWSPWDSTELAVDNLLISGADSIASGTGAPEFRMTWPPFDKAGQNLPGGFTINGVGAYNSLAFLPRGTRMQYYFKAVDINGGTVYQFSTDLIAREVEDLPTLPNSANKAPDIIELSILPRKYANGSAASLLAGRNNTPVLNLDGAHTAWSFQYDPMTQALRGLGVRADRYRHLQGLGQGNGVGGHELLGPPDNQRPDRLSNYFPNMTEYGIKDSLANWYKIIIQSSHNRTATLDDESDSRLLEEWWLTSTGTNGGDRCIFVSGEDYFNAILNIPAGEASARRISYGQNVLGVNSATGAWNGTATVPYPTVEDRFANPGAGPGLLAGYTYPVDGGCPTPNRFDALTKSGSSEHQNSAFYPLFAGVNDVAAVATLAERDPVGDTDRNKALGYGFSIQYVRKAGIPVAAANYVRSGVEERMRIMYKFLTSCRGPFAGPAAPCWPCPTDANMTGNWAALAGFQTATYGPLYPIQDHLAATGVEIEEASAAPRVNKLEGNFPNPFNPQTTIKFAAAQAGKVTVRIFNVGGQLVRTITAKAEVGANEVRWNGRRDDGASLASGIYFYKVKFADGSESGSRMALVK